MPVSVTLIPGVNSGTHLDPLALNKMGLSIHPSEAISEGICSACGDALEGFEAYFTINLDSVITRQTKCPPLHRKCAVDLAKEQFTVHAIWFSGYTYTSPGEPVFALEKSISPLEFDGEGDCTKEGVSLALSGAWLGLCDALGDDADAMGAAAAALLPNRPIDFASFDLAQPRKVGVMSHG